MSRDRIPKNSGKAPAFQFYAADWLNDPLLITCSHVAKGVWIDIIARSYLMPKPGRFLIGSHILSRSEIEAILPGKKATKKKGWNELVAKNILKQDATGCWYVKRIVEDVALRDARRAAGILGGNPVLIKQEVGNLLKQNANQKPTPSASASVSSNNTPPPPPQNYKPGTRAQMTAKPKPGGGGADFFSSSRGGGGRRKKVMPDQIPTIGDVLSECLKKDGGKNVEAQ